MRDNKGVPINIEAIRFALDLRGIWMLATQRIFCSRHPETGKVIEIPVPEMPEDIIYPAEAYLGELPGYDTSVPYNEQKGDEPSKQHGFALFYFTATFTQLAVSRGRGDRAVRRTPDLRQAVFYAKVNANGLIRLNAPLMLAAPAPRDRGRYCRGRTESDAGTRAPGVRPPYVMERRDGRTAAVCWSVQYSLMGSSITGAIP